MIENILLILVLLILSAKILGSIFDKIGLDSSIGELLVGLLFGQSMLNLVPAEKIEVFGLIGSILILFIAGMKQENVEEIIKDKKAIDLGLMLLFITGIGMAIFFYFVSPYFGVNLNIIQSITLAIAFAIIDIGVPAHILISHGLIGQPIGKIVLRSAIANIIAGLSIFTIVSLFLKGNLISIAVQFGEVVAFLALTVILMFSLSRLSKFVMKIHIEEAEFSLALILVLALAYLSEAIGFSSVLGAFIAGLIITRTPFSETKSFSDKLKSISFGLFVPLFFVWFGLSINLHDLLNNLFFAAVIFLLYCGVRFIVAYIFMKKNNFEMPALISSSLLSVDVESLVVLIMAGRIGIFKDNLALSLFAPSVLFSTLIIVILVKIFSNKKPQLNAAL
ncbi:MAG: cation:proton antiporter [archaeon]